MKTTVHNIKPESGGVEKLAEQIAELSDQMENLQETIVEGITEALKPLANVLSERLKTTRADAGITVHGRQEKRSPDTAGFKLPKGDDDGKVIGNNLYKLPKAG